MARTASSSSSFWASVTSTSKSGCTLPSPVRNRSTGSSTGMTSTSVCGTLPGLCNMNRRCLILILIVLLLVSPGLAQDDYIRSSRLGITFISALDSPRNEHRYQRALLIGVGWNRWPLYWDVVERQSGVYDWS